MSVENRPFAGSWKLGAKKLVQHTPDALVYINGDLALPGCQKCNSRIDIQKFLTEVSVDAGTDPGAASASFSLSMPAHESSSISRDAQWILRAGLEVHIYMRGYFPVKGLYSNLARGAERKATPATPTSTEGSGVRYRPVDFLNRGEKIGDLTSEQLANLQDLGANMETVHQYMEGLGGRGLLPEYAGGLKVSNRDAFSSGGHEENSQHYDGKAVDLRVSYVNTQGKTVYADATTTWAVLSKLRSAGYVSKGGVGAYVEATRKEGAPAGSTKASDYVPTQSWTDPPHYDTRGYNVNWCWYTVKQPDGSSLNIKKGGVVPKPFLEKVKGLPSPASLGVVKWSEHNNPVAIVRAGAGNSGEAPEGPTFLQDNNLAGYDIENVLAYPYYHVFHGVVTQVTHSYSGGANNVSVQCVSMLHFWQFHQMSTNASIFGARASNSGLKSTLKGNNFTGKHPYEIMYELHHDTAGAAGGVAWAISQQTNQESKSSLTGESLFSLNIKYWQQRFNTRDIKLRMHGATGEMFNSLQAAYLSRLSSTQLTALLRGRFGASTGVSTKILNESLTVGLGNKRKLEALLYARKTQGTASKGSTPNFELSMPEMIAFVSDIGQWAQVQLFESTYESKLDIANKVCEVTGFEFYQDVDGDFVFKPPMYNLDTSSSRIYRIEDIDIVSISFEDKEPQATYMVGKGSHFSNQAGTGLEGEWGVQGQYIDYRLVAQFGWRPGNFETAYLTDPRSVFFAAVNRLDILNAPTKSATVSIPLRPELRPGYPVYIPYLDAFYYCNSFAHAFSVGGSCTTSLQLIAKRAKFFAPGDVTQTGIEAIHLEYPSLPQKPLQVVDDAGRPVLSGFPNVVMALDPKQIDPLFFIVGTDVENVQDQETLEGLVKMAMSLGILTNAGPDPEHPGPYFKMSLDETTTATFFFPLEDSPTNVKEPSGGSVVRLQETAKLYVTKKEGLVQGLAKSDPALNSAKTEVASLQKQRSALDLDTPKGKKSAITLDKKLRAAEKKVATLVSSAEKKIQAFDSTPAIAPLITLIKQVSEKFVGSKQFSDRFGGNPGSALTLLSMLSDRKAVFTNGSLPGSYRYYSCSHPSDNQQGMPNLTLNIRQSKAATGGKLKVLSASYLEPFWKNQRVKTYQISSMIENKPGQTTPEAQFHETTPRYGIKVLTSRPDLPTGEVIPTSEIRELMFTPHTLLATQSKGNRKRQAAKKTGAGLSFRKAFSDEAAAMVGDPADNALLGTALSGWVAVVTKNIESAVDSVRANHKNWSIQSFPQVAVPGTIVYQGGEIKTFVPMNTYRFAGDTDKTKPEAFPESSVRSLRAFWKEAAISFGESYFGAFLRTLGEWERVLSATDFSEEDTKTIMAEFLTVLKGKYKVTEHAKAGDASAGQKDVATPVFSPVFPISDAKGYEVVGSYRYGRDVNIDPEGVFDVLHRQDPMAMLSKDLVDKILTSVVRKETIQVPYTEVINGNTVTKYRNVSGEAANLAVSEEALKVWRRNYSDQDLLDLGLARMDGNVLVANLSNWITNKGKDGIQKIPVINAAYSLADLAPHTTKNFCSCKAAEADVLLDIAGQQNFVQYSQKGEGSLDKVTAWLKSATEVASIPWEQSQEALRGSAVNSQGSSLIQTALGIADSFEAAGQEMERRKQALLDAFDNLDRLGD